MALINLDPEESSYKRDEIRARVMADVPAFLRWLYPCVRFNSREAEIADVYGKPGASLKITVNGPKAGLWHDFSTDEGGDLFDLFAASKNLDSKRDFKSVLEQIASQYCGLSSTPDANGKINGAKHTPTTPAWRPLLPVPDDAPPLAPADFSAAGVPQAFSLTALWAYRDGRGKLLGYVVRFDNRTASNSEKTFRPFTFCTSAAAPKGVWRSQGFPEPRPLYCLDKLAARPDAPVLIVEGEKAADAARTIFPEHVVTTSINGSGGARKSDWTSLAGRDCSIWPDNDAPGAKYAADVFATATAAGAKSSRIVALPPRLPGGWDLADPLPEGLTFDDLRGLVADAGGGVGPDAQPATDKPAADDSPFPLRWHGDADNTLLREWLVEQTLAKRGTSLLSGQWGTYKTFVAFDLAGSIMTRTPFAGRAVNRQGGVLFVAAEGQDEVKVRLAGIIQEKVAGALDRAEDFTAVDPLAMPFVWIESCPKLSSPDALTSLRKIVAAAAKGMQERFGLPLAMMVIDTLSPAAEFKDANDSAENQRVMSLLKTIANESELCIIAVDHMGKDVSTGTRNSSVKEADADAVLALLGERDLAGNVSNSRMAIRKVRGAPTGEEIRFDKRVVHVEDRGKTFTTLVIDWARAGEGAESTAPKASRWPKSLLIFKRALDAAMSDFGRKLRPFSDGPEVLAVDREKVRDEFLKAYPADNHNAKREAFRRCEKQAVERGAIVSREINQETLFWLVRDDTP